MGNFYYVKTQETTKAIMFYLSTKQIFQEKSEFSVVQRL